MCMICLLQAAVSFRCVRNNAVRNIKM